MIKINYDNLLVNSDFSKSQDILEKILQQDDFSFEKIKTDLKYIIEKTEKFKKFKNIILIGNGGSRTSAWAFFHSLFEYRNKTNFKFLASVEPELINELKKQYKKEDTLILIISKSGANINSLEPLLSFLDYQVLVITGEKDNPLRQIAQKKRWDIIVHPEVGGRYSGMTSCGLVPAYLMGLDIEKIYKGARKGYQFYNNKVEIEKNNALKLAWYFCKLEKKGYAEIFSSLYSTSLFAFLPLIIQLVHESSGKDGKGQIIFGDYAPESQHHTNQRFFGGTKNVAGLLVGVENSEDDFKIEIPLELEDIKFDGVALKKLAGLSALKSMHFDRQGVLENCINKKIPVVEVLISEISQENMGEWMVFWQYFAVYSSMLRRVDPFNQPAVEESKLISFNLRVGNSLG